VSRPLVADAETLSKARALKDELFRKLVGGSLYEERPRTKVFPRTSNLVGVGYGVKITGTSHGADEAVRVYVRRKRVKKSLSAKEMVPGFINGIPTDVIGVGNVRPLAHAWPVSCGASIGHFDVTVGTIGCRVKRPGDAAEYVLSNNHVLADANAAALGDEIVQPAPNDAGNRGAPPAGDTIATLARFAPLQFNGANDIDAAIARLAIPGTVSAVIDGIGSIVNPPLPATTFASVRKSGRSTGVTIGIIEDVAASLGVPYGAQTATFHEQIKIVGVNGAFSDVGDSGALVVDAVTRQPIGLLFAGDDHGSYANPIQKVLSFFGVTIV
jgi:hypothetical protein